MRISPRSSHLCFAISACGSLVSPASTQAQARWYSSVAGIDTLTLERVERTGSTISGLWVTYHNGVDRHREIMRHEYTIVLGAQDRPESAHLLVRHPGGGVDYTYDARFMTDTTVITLSPDTVGRRSIVAQHASPLLGSSIGMFEAFIAGARGSHRAPDTVNVAAVPITGPFVARPIPIVLLSANAVRFGPGGPTIYTDARGALDSIVGTPGLVLRRVASFDIDAIALAASRSAPTANSPATQPAPRRSDARDDRFVGRWDSVLDAGTAKLRLAITLHRDPDGGLTGLTKSIDQGDVEVATTAMVRGDTLVLTMGGGGATFRGRLNDAGDAVTGTLEQGAMFPLTLIRSRSNP